MSPLHNVLVAFGGVLLLAALVVFMAGGFKTRNKTWNAVFIMTGSMLFVPRLILGVMSLVV